jgi:hypothetical protein
VVWPFEPSADLELGTLRRPTLRSQLNQIRLWLRQGRTEAWIAHKLDISVATLEQFKRDHRLGAEQSAPESTAPEPAERPAPSSGLAPDEDEEEEEEEELEREPETVGAVFDSSDVPAPTEPDGDSGFEPDVSGTDAAVVETETVGIGPEEAGSEAVGAVEEVETAAREPEEEGEEEAPGRRRRRRRGRRGGRRRGAKQAQYEATFDHGEEVYALRLDPAVADNPVYEKHWAGHRTVAVILEPDAITILRLEDQEEPRE